MLSSACLADVNNTISDLGSFHARQPNWRDFSNGPWIFDIVSLWRKMEAALSSPPLSLPLFLFCYTKYWERKIFNRRFVAVELSICSDRYPHPQAFGTDLAVTACVGRAFEHTRVSEFRVSPGSLTNPHIWTPNSVPISFYVAREPFGIGLSSKIPLHVTDCWLPPEDRTTYPRIVCEHFYLGSLLTGKKRNNPICSFRFATHGDRILRKRLINQSHSVCFQVKNPRVFTKLCS